MTNEDTNKNMKLYNNADIRRLKPYYDPARYYSDDDNEDYTLIDILDREDIPVIDRLWVVTKLIPEKEARLFAVWCARDALKLVDNPDPRSIEACNVAERFAHGKATKDELQEAKEAAKEVTWDTAKEATWDIAKDIAKAAAKAAAKVAMDAARDAAGGVVDSAAGSNTRKRQLDKLKDMVIGLKEAIND